MSFLSFLSINGVVIIGGLGDGGLADLGPDDAVSVAHPDALPDGLLDLVVVLVGRHQELVERGQVVAVEVLRRAQLPLLHRVFGALADQVRLADLLQGLMEMK